MVAVMVTRTPNWYAFHSEPQAPTMFWRFVDRS
jgi:hypothetical protein